MSSLLTDLTGDLGCCVAAGARVSFSKVAFEHLRVASSRHDYD